jgi:hypothetical protein
MPQPGLVLTNISDGCLNDWPVSECNYYAWCHGCRGDAEMKVDGRCVSLSEICYRFDS